MYACLRTSAPLTQPHHLLYNGVQLLWRKHIWHKLATNVPAHIFREYDIRGVVDKDLTDDVYYYLGRA